MAAYEGELVVACPSTAYFAHGLELVVVSGAVWNPCGHALLYSKSTRRYFHVAGGFHTYPRTMNEEQYRRYMREQGKHELHRDRLTIPNPLAAHLRMEELLSQKWSWLILPHNCVSFVEEIIKAGGGSAGVYFNCPSREAFR